MPDALSLSLGKAKGSPVEMPQLCNRIQMRAARYLLANSTHDLSQPVSAGELSELRVHQIFIAPKSGGAKKTQVRLSDNGSLQRRRLDFVVEEKGKPVELKRGETVDLTPSDLETMSLNSFYHYGFGAIAYGGVIYPAIKRLLGLEALRVKRYMRRRRRAAAKAKPIGTRYEVLKAVMEMNDSGGVCISEAALVVRFHGPEALRFEDEARTRLFKPIGNALKGLVDSKDLRVNGNEYAPTDQAFNTLNKWESERLTQERFDRQQNFMIGLTFVLAIAAVAALFKP